MNADDINNFREIMKNAVEAWKNLNVTMYKVQSENYQKMRTVSSAEDLPANEEYFMQIPQEYEDRYINALSVGLKGIEAYNLLSETFEF